MILQFSAVTEDESGEFPYFFELFCSSIGRNSSSVDSVSKIIRSRILSAISRNWKRTSVRMWERFSDGLDDSVPAGFRKTVRLLSSDGRLVSSVELVMSIVETKAETG